LVRDNLRGQAYNMKANMIAINDVLPADKKVAAKKAYSKFWSEINSCAPHPHMRTVHALPLSSVRSSFSCFVCSLASSSHVVPHNVNSVWFVGRIRATAGWTLLA
jgi:hypothetical protein